jgi:hypothetical protein
VRFLAIIVFACSMAIVALNLQGCAGSDIHPSTASLKWVD